VNHTGRLFRACALMLAALYLAGCAAYQEAHAHIDLRPDGTITHADCSVYTVFQIGSVTTSAELPGGILNDAQSAAGATLTLEHVCVDASTGRQSTETANTVQNIASGLIGAALGFFSHGLVK
jgi:hypothetical protein